MSRAFRPEIRGRGHPAGIHAASRPTGGTSRPRRALCAGRLGFADIDRAPPLFLAKGEPPLKPAAGIDKSSAYPAGGVG
jgi:hypothetical protein